MQGNTGFKNIGQGNTGDLNEGNGNFGFKNQGDVSRAGSNSKHCCLCIDSPYVT